MDSSKKPKSLRDDDIKSRRSVDRRALLGGLGIGGVAAFSSLLGTAMAQSQGSRSEAGSRPRTGATDGDPSDPAFGGKGRPSGGTTDVDPSDAAGRGRGAPPRGEEKRR